MIYFKLHFARKLPVDLIFPAYIASPSTSICTICGHATTCAKRLRRSRITNAIWKLLNGEYYILFVLRVLFGASQVFFPFLVNIIFNCRNHHRLCDQAMDAAEPHCCGSDRRPGLYVRPVLAAGVRHERTHGQRAELHLLWTAVARVLGILMSVEVKF